MPEARERLRTFELSRGNRNFVFDLGDSGGVPGDAFGLLTFEPRVNRTLQDNFAATGFDFDPLSIKLGVPFQCLFNFVFHTGFTRRRLNLNEIDDSFYAPKITHGVFGSCPLVSPVDSAFQGDPTLIYDNFNFVARNTTGPVERICRRLCNILVGALARTR